MIKKLLVAVLLLAPLGASAAIRSVAQQTVGPVMMTTPLFVSNGFNTATTGLSTSATSYGPMVGGMSVTTGTWGSPLAGNQWPVPTAGTISNLKVFALTTITQGSYTLSLNKAGSASALTCAVSNGTQTCADTSHNITVAPGDLIAVQSVPSGTPTTQTLPFYIAMTFTSTVGQESPILGGSIEINNMSTSVQNFASIGGGQTAWNATENLVSSVMPVAGTIDQLYVATNPAPGGAASYAMTVYKNGSSTAITCTVTAAATTCNDTNAGHAVAVVAGDTISMSATPSGTPTGATPTYSLRWVPTTQNKAVVFMQPSTMPGTANSSHYGQFGGGFADGTVDTGAAQTIAPVNFTVTDAYISYCPGPGAAVHRSLRLRTTATPNTSTTNSSLFAAAANGTTACPTRTTASATGSIAVTAGMGLASEEFPSASPTAATQFAGSYALTVP